MKTGNPAIKEYKTSKGWALFVYLISPFLIGLFLWLMFLPFKDGDFTVNAGWIIIPLSLAMIAALVYGLLETYKGRFIIKQKSVLSIKSYSKTELFISEIEGYTEDEYYIHIESKSEDKDDIKISKYFSNHYEITSWLDRHYPNLDDKRERKEKQAILKNKRFGSTKTDRAQSLRLAEKNAKWINILGGVISTWAFFNPKPYNVVMILAILTPLVAILVLKLHGGLIKIDQNIGSPYPSVVYALLYPPLVIFARAILDFDILDYSKVWALSLGLTFIIVLILFLIAKETNPDRPTDYKSLLIITPFYLAYSFGAVLHINCCYDNSKPQYHMVTVIEKSKTSNRSDSYYLHLSPRDNQQEVKKTRVSSKRYNNTIVGNELNVRLKNGKFGIPWHELPTQ